MIILYPISALLNYVQTWKTSTLLMVTTLINYLFRIGQVHTYEYRRSRNVARACDTFLQNKRETPTGKKTATFPFLPLNGNNTVWGKPVYVN